MNRSLHRVAVAISALLLFVGLIQWARSYVQLQNWAWATNAREYHLFSHWGGLYVAGIANWSAPHALVYRPEGPYGWDRWGDESYYLLEKARPWLPTYVTGSLRNDGLQPCWVLVLPYWVFCAVLSLLPFRVALRYMRSSRRARLGCCARCGYDLRASGPRCPECGHVRE